MANDLLVNIDVPDLPRAVAFYTETFGLTVTRRFGADGVDLPSWPARSAFCKSRRARNFFKSRRARSAQATALAATIGIGRRFIWTLRCTTWQPHCRASGKLTACGRCVANRGATSPRTIA